MIKFIIQVLFFSTITSSLAQQSSLSKAVNYISKYIASEEFVLAKKKFGDVAAVDTLFNKAIITTNGNISECLLALMFSTVPYREIPINIPILNSTVYYPLISAEEELFFKKNDNLPRYLFFDSPIDEFGDKDKLAHFFGSAYLAYESHIFDLGKLIGYFVEVFEENFKVQSSIDYRDLDVNDYGRLFGDQLKTNDQLLPSNIFLIRSLRFFRVKL